LALGVKRLIKCNSSHNAKEGNREYWANKVAIFCDNGADVIFSLTHEIGVYKRNDTGMIVAALPVEMNI